MDSDLIFCNKCFAIIKEAHSKFFITNCQHVVCKNCFIQKNHCVICNKQCKEYPIDENLPKEINNYFDPLAVIKSLETASKIQKFQEMQKKAFIQKYYGFRRKYHEKKKMAQKIMEFSKSQIDQLRREKLCIEKLKQSYNSKKYPPDLFRPSTFQKKPSPLAAAAPNSDSGFFTPTTTSQKPSSHHHHNVSFSGIPISESSSKNLLSNSFADGRSIENNSKDIRRAHLMNDARKQLVANTMRDMNEASQHRTQLKRAQYMQMTTPINHFPRPR